jgi:hypothetical protein
VIKDAGKRNLLQELGGLIAEDGLNVAVENRTRIEILRNNLHRMQDGQ